MYMNMGQYEQQLRKIFKHFASRNMIQRGTLSVENWYVYVYIT